MIIALILSLAGLVCSGLGMRCTSALEEDSNAKRWVVIAGGICHIGAGKWWKKLLIYTFKTTPNN